jgi:Zn-dependent protease with chaperone function
LGIFWLPDDKGVPRKLQLANHSKKDRQMRGLGIFVILVVLGGCAQPVDPVGATRTFDVTPEPAQVTRSFGDVVRRIEPVAESFCRARTRKMNCDFQFLINTKPGQPANAFQRVDSRGRPVIIVNRALLRQVRNIDEMAFILGHETGHHINGHLERKQANATTGAILMGTLAELGGAGRAEIDTAVELGAKLGARKFSKAYELEADQLGTVIAAQAGFNPVRGAAFFTRIPDPGNLFLGTHPPNAARIEIVRRTAARL